MSFTAREVMERAQSILNDSGAARWTLPELRRWLNDGLREIAILAPDALAQVEYIKLGAGTLQVIPDHIASIIRVNANVIGVPVTVRGRQTLSSITRRLRAVTPIKKMTLDALEPGWQDGAVMPQQANVVHFVEDSVMNGNFLVAPGLTAPATAGHGWLEVVAAVIPEMVPLPANSLDITSYSGVVDLNDLYQNALLDYVLSKSFQKEINVQGSAQRAIMHYQAFAGAIGVRTPKKTEHQPSSDTGSNPRNMG